jgi:hypothetical protein
MTTTTTSGRGRGRRAVARAAGAGLLGGAETAGRMVAGHRVDERRQLRRSSSSPAFTLESVKFVARDQVVASQFLGSKALVLDCLENSPAGDRKLGRRHIRSHPFPLHELQRTGELRFVKSIPRWTFMCPIW